MLAREHLTHPHPHRAWPWRADESPLNDLDDAESDTELMPRTSCRKKSSNSWRKSRHHRASSRPGPL